MRPHYYRANVDRVMKHSDPTKWGTSQATIILTAPRATPQGSLLVRGARVVTMKGDEVIDRGDILVTNNRIAQIGANLSGPTGARIIDVAGKTIIPDIVDVHAHPKTGREMAPDQEWSIASNLAHGVTTTRNPSGTRWNVAWRELIDAGEMVVRRYKAQGVNSLKQYLQPRRIQRQWILQAAGAEGMNATNEGAGDLKANITMAIDGYTGLEHSIGQVPIYKDVITVLADSKITWTSTLVVAYGAPGGDTYWRARTDLDRDPKTSFFTPADILYCARSRATT